MPVFVDEALPGDTFNCNMAAFARLVSAATEGGWITIATLRSDFLITLQNSAELGPVVETGQLWPIAPMRESELGKIVEGPTKHWPIALMKTLLCPSVMGRQFPNPLSLLK